MEQKLSKKQLYVSMFLMFLMYPGLNFGHPVTPAYIRDLGLPKNLSFSLLFSTMSLALLLFSPFWGNLGDKYKRRIPLAIGVLGYGIGQFLLSYFTSLETIIIARFISGLFAAAIFTNAAAFIAENTSLENRTKSLSIFVGLTVFGSSVGYQIGGRLGLISPQFAFEMQGLYNLLVAIIIFIFLPQADTIKTKRKNAIESLKHLSEINKNYIYVLIATTLFALAQNNNSKFLDVYLSDIGFNTARIGTFVLITGFVNMAVTFILVPFLSKRFKEINIMRIALIFAVFFLPLTFIIQSRYMIWTSYMAYYIMICIYVPIDQSYISKQITSHYGVVLGIRESFRSFGLFIGPLLILLLQFLVPNYQTSYTFYFDTIILVVSFLFLMNYVRRSRK